MNTLPVAFISAAAAMTIGQLSKAFMPLFKGKPPAFKDVLKAGGMPSAHTAACASMALTVGFRDGFSSSAFAVAGVLTAVVAHDAVKVRGTLNTLINILRRTAPEEVLKEEDHLPETVGHSVGEVAVGFVLAGVIAPVSHLLLP